MEPESVENEGGAHLNGNRLEEIGEGVGAGPKIKGCGFLTRRISIGEGVQQEYGRSVGQQKKDGKTEQGRAKRNTDDLFRPPAPGMWSDHVHVPRDGHPATAVGKANAHRPGGGFGQLDDSVEPLVGRTLVLRPPFEDPLALDADLEADA